jgi:hypothetical protein
MKAVLLKSSLERSVDPSPLKAVDRTTMTIAVSETIVLPKRSSVALVGATVIDVVSK